MARQNLGISEIRNITGILSDRGYPDFAGYAYGSLKRRLESAMEHFSLSDTGQMEQRILSDDTFPGLLADQIQVDTTELFRDPSMWRMLRDMVFPKLFSSSDRVWFWIPGCSSAEDPVSLAILLREANLLNRSGIMISSLNDSTIEIIKRGEFRQSKLEVNQSNYQKIMGEGELSFYLGKCGDKTVFNPSLLEGFSFFSAPTHDYAVKEAVNCVIFRDRMIYFNPALANRVLSTISTCLVTGGYLVVGSGEDLSHLVAGRDYVCDNEGERIYRKIKL